VQTFQLTFHNRKHQNCGFLGQIMHFQALPRRNICTYSVLQYCKQCLKRKCWFLLPVNMQKLTTLRPNIVQTHKRQYCFTLCPPVCPSRCDTVSAPTVKLFWPLRGGIILFLNPTNIKKFQRTPQFSLRCISGKIWDFQPKSSFISETIQGRPIVTVLWITNSKSGSRFSYTGSYDLQQPWKMDVGRDGDIRLYNITMAIKLLLQPILRPSAVPMLSVRPSVCLCQMLVEC